METIVIALISAGTGALITFLGNIVFRLFDRGDKKRELKETKKTQFYADKKHAYLVALNKLLFIKRGFSITKEDLQSSPTLLKKFQNDKDELKYADSLFRLYASDKVFNFYFSLLQKYKPYSYVSENDYRLLEDSKNNFDKGIFILSRLMQEDLEYREYDKEINEIECPCCRRHHDFVKTCKCGLTFQQLQEKLLDIQTKKN